jgi:poly(3-hydroxybutyrate) depolymerase
MKKCWNWFNATEQRRDGGELSLLAGIALRTIDEFSADPARVYVGALSAGGAAAAILATTHPDPCAAARDMPSAFAAVAGKTPFPRQNTPAVPMIVFHVVNADHVAAQAGMATVLSEIITHGETPDSVT